MAEDDPLIGLHVAELQVAELHVALEKGLNGVKLCGSARPWRPGRSRIPRIPCVNIDLGMQRKLAEAHEQLELE